MAIPPECHINVNWSGICFLGTKGCIDNHSAERELKLRIEECDRLREINHSLVEAHNRMVIHEARLAEECQLVKQERDSLLDQLEKFKLPRSKANVYVAYSRTQDECTISNAVFDEFEDAVRYRKEVLDSVGCELEIVRMAYLKSFIKNGDNRTPPPQDSVIVEKLKAALTDLLNFAESNICQHENTRRGGAIWEICEDCGAKWADDRGGKPPFEWPKEIQQAETILKELQ